MNATLIDAIWNSLRHGEAKTLAALADEVGQFLKGPVNRFRLETELLGLVDERRLTREGDAFRAIPGLALVKPTPPPVPRPGHVAGERPPRAPKPPRPSSATDRLAPEPELDEPAMGYIREAVARLGNRYAAERFYQEDCPVDRYAQKAAASLYPEQKPSKYVLRRKRKARPAPSVSSAPDAPGGNGNGSSEPAVPVPAPGEAQP